MNNKINENLNAEREQELAVIRDELLLLERERDEAREALEFRRGLYKVQEEYLESERNTRNAIIAKGLELKKQLDEARAEWGKASMDAAQLLSEKTKVMEERDELQMAVNGLCLHLGVSPANTTLLAVEVLRIQRERDEAREEINSIRRMLAQNGEAVGNGEHDFSIIEMVENLMQSRGYFIRKSDSIERERDGARAENKKLREALLRVRTWGIESKNFSSNDNGKMAHWIDGGCTGELPDPDGPWIYERMEENAKLRRERDEARDQRNRLHELHNQNAMRHNELLELCVTLREELDEARVALMEIEDRCVDCKDACDDIQKIRDIAVKALGGAK